MRRNANTKHRTIEGQANACVVKKNAPSWSSLQWNLSPFSQCRSSTVRSLQPFVSSQSCSQINPRSKGRKVPMRMGEWQLDCDGDKDTEGRKEEHTHTHTQTRDKAQTRTSAHFVGSLGSGLYSIDSLMVSRLQNVTFCDTICSFCCCGSTREASTA